jgi:gas vesicle structural protein
MTATTVRYPPHSYLQRPAPSGLAEVVELILDKGLVIDLFVRVALVGIEILTIDARIVVASVDTYLRFAEAVDRLDLSRKEPRQLPEFLAEVKEKGARKVTKGSSQRSN